MVTSLFQSCNCSLQNQSLLVEHFLSLHLQLFQISFKDKVLNSKVTKESCIHHSGPKYLLLQIAQETGALGPQYV